MLASCASQIPENLPEVPNLRLVCVSAGILIDRDGQILVTQRPEGKAMAGMWEFPGGKLESGETPEYALCRELKEELDIMTCPACLQSLTFASYSYDDFHLLMPVFACRNWQGMITPKEGQAMQWVSLSQLSSLEMPPADIPLIPILHQML